MTDLIYIGLTLLLLFLSLAFVGLCERMLGDGK